MYGDPRLVKEVGNALSDAHLFYGGGIDRRERAREMAEHATIVVGNILYRDMEKYLETLQYD
jgi:heptaprenylglyceryl phosphate synthase